MGKEKARLTSGLVDIRLRLPVQGREDFGQWAGISNLPHQLLYTIAAHEILEGIKLCTIEVSAQCRSAAKFVFLETVTHVTVSHCHVEVDEHFAVNVFSLARHFRNSLHLVKRIGKLVSNLKRFYVLSIRHIQCNPHLSAPVASGFVRSCVYSINQNFGFVNRQFEAI